MIRFLRVLAEVLERVNGLVGKVVSWLALGLALLTAFIVFERYVLSASSIWLSELNWHLAALVFLLGAACTLQTSRPPCLQSAPRRSGGWGIRVARRSPSST